MVHPISDIVGWSPRYFSKKTNLIFLMKTSSIKLGKKKTVLVHIISVTVGPPKCATEPCLKERHNIID